MLRYQQCTAVVGGVAGLLSLGARKCFLQDRRFVKRLLTPGIKRKGIACTFLQVPLRIHLFHGAAKCASVAIVVRAQLGFLSAFSLPWLVLVLLNALHFVSGSTL